MTQIEESLEWAVALKPDSSHSHADSRVCWLHGDLCPRLRQGLVGHATLGEAKASTQLTQKIFFEMTVPRAQLTVVSWQTQAQAL